MTNFLNTDREIERYDEAELFAETAKPEMFPDIRSKFNVDTGRTDLMAPLPSGGFVTLASNAPDIMVEAPAMPGQGADAALPVEGPIARAAEQTALETEPAGSGRNRGRKDRPREMSAQAQVVKEVTKGLARGGIVEPAQFIDETAGGMGGIQFQIVNPETGEFDPAIRIVSAEERAETQRRMAAGELPFAFDLEALTQADTDASGVAQAAGGIAQFVGAYAGIGKLFRVGSGFKAGMTQGAAADFLGFDGSDASITDMLLEMGVPDEMLPDFLEKDPTDPDYVGRFQAAVEGAGLGAVIEKGLIPILGLAFRAVKDKDVPVDAARQAIQQGKLMMQGALLKAGQNAELRMAERGPAVDFLANTMMSGVDPTIATDPLVAAAGRAVGGDRVAEIKTKYPNVQLDIYGDAKKGFELGRIEIPEAERSSGLGTAVMNDIIKMADDQGAVISLTPDKSFGGSSVSRLKKFYKKFGFVENKGKNKDFSTRNTMIRQPAVTAVDDGFVAKVEPPTDDTPGIIAFHGSAADFDGFKLEKIGTGEGAQAYGYGLYFADKEDIAKYYRDFLSKSIDVDGKPFIRGNNIFDEVLGGDQDLADNLGATQGDLEQAIKEAKETRQEMLDFGNEEAADIYADELYKLEQLRGRVTDNSSKGHMYKVGLVPKPDEMLDYYKPLSEQPDNIQAAYKKAYHNKFIKGDADLEVLFANPNDLTMQDMGIFDKSTGAQAYRELADKLGSIDWPVGADAKTRQEFRTKGEAAAVRRCLRQAFPASSSLTIQREKQAEPQATTSYLMTA